MKWLVFLLLLTGYAQVAQAVFWFQFTPCGFTDFKYFEQAEPLYTPAPNLTVLLWRIPPTAVIQIVGVKAKGRDIECSWLAVNGDQWLVVGSPRELYDLLAAKRMPDFEEIEKR